MAKIDRYDGNLQAFASGSIGTERTVFGETTQSNTLTDQLTPEFIRGWGIVGPSDQPSLQDFNAVSYTHGQLLAYLHQMGIAEYNATQEYHIGSVCQVGGEIYISLQNTNVGNAPATSPTAWQAKSSGRLLGSQVFTASGTYTPSSGTKSIIVEIQGGGGGGGGGGSSATLSFVAGGGGSGGYLKSRITSPAVTAVTVGTGGAGGTSGGNGVTGGNSSFGALTANGGSGGISTSSTGVAAAGSGSGGGATGGNILSVPGSSGSPGYLVAGASGNSGNGGPGRLSGGGRGAPLGNGGAAGGYGGGGGGALSINNSTNFTGGAGSPGVVIVWEFG